MMSNFCDEFIAVLAISLASFAISFDPSCSEQVLIETIIAIIDKKTITISLIRLKIRTNFLLFNLFIVLLILFYLVQSM